MEDIRSTIVERTDGSERRRVWPAVLAALLVGALAGELIGEARGPDQGELDATRERAARAERLVIALKGERDRLNGQIGDDHVIISELQLRLAGR
jgi:hypothetical protein